MATSSNSPTLPDRDSHATSSGLTTGAGPDLSRAAAPAKPASKSRARSKGTQLGIDASADTLPGKGLSTAKPATKAKSKAGTEGKAPLGKGSSAKGRTVAGAAEQSAAPGVGPSVDAGGGAVGGADAESTSAQTEAQGQRMSDEERQRRIADAAYRKAQERGFDGNREIDDWLEAEREVDQGGARAG